MFWYLIIKYSYANKVINYRYNVKCMAISTYMKIALHEGLLKINLLLL